MRKIITATLIFILSLGTSFAQSNSTSTYEKINDISEITDDGIYLIAYPRENGDVYILSTGYIDGKKFSQPVKTTGSDTGSTKITLNNNQELQFLECKIMRIENENDNGYYIINNSKYISYSNSTVQLLGTPDNSSKWTISPKRDDNTRFLFKITDNRKEYQLNFFRNSGTNLYFLISDTSNPPSIYKKKPTSHTVSIASAGYSTFYYSNCDATLPDGLTAYTYNLEGNGESMKLVPSHVFSAGEKIPADCAVVLKGTEGSYSLALSEPDTTIIKPKHNMLKGTDEAKDLADESLFFYKLSLDNESKNIGFYWTNDNGDKLTNNAHKAYLALPRSSNVKGKSFIFNQEDSEATAIIQTEISTKATNIIYDLTGRKITRPSHGLYIINGKKYIK